MKPSRATRARNAARREEGKRDGGTQGGGRRGQGGGWREEAFLQAGHWYDSVAHRPTVPGASFSQHACTHRPQSPHSSISRSFPPWSPNVQGQEAFGQPRARRGMGRRELCKTEFTAPPERLPHQASPTSPPAPHLMCCISLAASRPTPQPYLRVRRPQERTDRTVLALVPAAPAGATEQAS